MPVESGMWAFMGVCKMGAVVEVDWPQWQRGAGPPLARNPGLGASGRRHRAPLATSRLPPSHYLRSFTKRNLGLLRAMGAKHQAVCRVLLGVIHDIIPLPCRQGLANNRSRGPLIRFVRALPGFVCLAQHGEANEELLMKSDETLYRFHNKKAVFVREGARKSFNLPKPH
ncbi:unnamed protein product [Peniophora sp. CBMAI 1063]|nr:unnamed protein product [Peniophora sp. CBMAI 1063]